MIVPKLFASLCVAALLTSCGGSSTAPALLTDAETKDLIRTEISHWEFAKLKNLGTLRTQLDNGYIGYFGTTALGPDATIETFKTADVRSYRMSSIKVLPLNSDAATVYYILDRDVVDNAGNTWAPKVAVSETYVRVGKEWKAKYYQETLMED